MKPDGEFTVTKQATNSTGMVLNPDLIIRELYAIKLAGEIAEMLGWTKTMVYKRATKLGLRKARPHMYASSFEAHVAKAVVHAAQVPHAMSKTDAGRCGGVAATEARTGWPRVTCTWGERLGARRYDEPATW